MAHQKFYRWVKIKRFIGEISQDFRTDRNIILQTVIPGHHQSLGATERRHAHFRGIIDHIIGNRKINFSTPKQWREFSAMTSLRLNSQVQQYDGFTPGKRVFGGAPKLPIGTLGNPNFNDCVNPKTAPTAKSMSLLRTIFQIRRASLEADFSGKINVCPSTRLRSRKTEEFCLGQTVYFYTERKTKAEKRWQGPGIIIPRYGNQYALVHFRGTYLEVSMGDLKSTDRVLDVLGCDGALQLHVGSTKFPLHYLVDSQKLIFVSKVRNGFLQRNLITWTNTDTRLSVREFYENDLNQQIANNELGENKRIESF